MKYVLVDREDNIIDNIELTREVSLSAAKTFFVGRKRIEEKEFDNLWKVMTETEHRRLKVHEETIREYEEFGSWLDVEKS